MINWNSMRCNQLQTWNHSAPPTFDLDQKKVEIVLHPPRHIEILSEMCQKRRWQTHITRVSQLRRSNESSKSDYDDENRITCRSAPAIDSSLGSCRFESATLAWRRNWEPSTPTQSSSEASLICKCAGNYVRKIRLKDPVKALTLASFRSTSSLDPANMLAKVETESSGGGGERNRSVILIDKSLLLVEPKTFD